MAQYDELRKKLVSSHGGKLVKGEVRAARCGCICSW
jgi:hypothetical protein